MEAIADLLVNYGIAVAIVAYSLLKDWKLSTKTITALTTVSNTLQAVNDLLPSIKNLLEYTVVKPIEKGDSVD